MIGDTVPPYTTPAGDSISDMLDEAINDRVEAVAMYRKSLSPFLTTTSPIVRVLDMLQSALHGRWAADTPEGSWLSVKELSWGTRIVETEIAELLLAIAFRPSVKLSRRMVDGTYRYTLGDGGGNGHV